MARLVAYRDALDTTEPDWCVQGVLEGLGLLWGEAGVGKSFIACSLAASVATGRPWLGHRVREGAVVYVAGEGGAASVARRLDAAVLALRCCDHDEPIPLWIVTPGVDMVAGMAEMVAVLGDVKPALIIIDTLARCFGGDENSTEDMSSFVRSLDLLRDLYGCSVLVVHHANKATDRSGAGKVRGSSVLYGAVDVSMQLVADGRTGAKLVADKLRDRDVTAPVAEFRFESVPMWGEVDDLGDVRTTRIVKPTAEFEAALVGIATVPMRGAVTYADWRASCPAYPKEMFDRMVTAIVGDPSTWGVHEHAPGAGVYGGAR